MLVVMTLRADNENFYLLQCNLKRVRLQKNIFLLFVVTLKNGSSFLFVADFSECFLLYNVIKANGQKSLEKG